MKTRGRLRDVMLAIAAIALILGLLREYPFPGVFGLTALFTVAPTVIFTRRFIKIVTNDSRTVGPAEWLSTWLLVSSASFPFLVVWLVVVPALLAGIASLLMSSTG